MKFFYEIRNFPDACKITNTDPLFKKGLKTNSSN